MGKHINIAIFTIANSIIRVNICYLFGDNLLLNSKNEKKNKGRNKSNNDILSKRKLTTIGTNLEPKTLDLLIFINFNLDSTLLSSYIMAIYPILYKLEPKKSNLMQIKNPILVFIS